MREKTTVLLVLTLIAFLQNCLSVMWTSSARDNIRGYKEFHTDETRMHDFAAIEKLTIAKKEENTEQPLSFKIYLNSENTANCLQITRNYRSYYYAQDLVECKDTIAAPIYLFKAKHHLSYKTHGKRYVTSLFTRQDTFFLEGV
ncbi:MAG: hypothetical protein AAF518_28205 [Spirochaetota bacterium]